MKVMILMLIMIQNQVRIMTNKRGPNPQLNIPLKQVKTIISEKINGRNRQSFTERKANTKYS